MMNVVALQRTFTSARVRRGSRVMAKKRSGKSRLPHVALLIETTRSYARNVLRGIGDYARIHGPWLFHLRTDAPMPSVPTRDEWDGDGIIAQTHQDQNIID